MTTQLIATTKPRLEKMDEFLAFVQGLMELQRPPKGEDWLPLFVCGFDTELPIITALPPRFFTDEASKDRLVVEACFIAAQEGA